MAAQTKAELLDELGSHTSKADLVEALGSKLKKDDLSSIVGDEDGTKDELVKKLGSRTKDELVEAVGAHMTKDEVQRLLDRQQSQRGSGDHRRARSDEDRSHDRTGILVGRRVRVDLSGLPMLGVFAGPGASAAGTVVDVDAPRRALRVHLDAGFDGEKEIVLPPERVALDR